MDAEAKKDLIMMFVAVVGTLTVISVIMVSFASILCVLATYLQCQIGIAYLAGARFDIAFKELSGGNFFPKTGEAAQKVVEQYDAHVEL